MDELRCNPFSARIVYLFSENGSGQLTFQKFINMMSVFSGRTSKQTKAVWAFALWDFDGKAFTEYTERSCAVLHIPLLFTAPALGLFVWVRVSLGIAAAQVMT